MDAQIEFIGRKKEREKLLKLLENREPEMVAVIGRRRVGKTFLIRHVYEKHLDFELTGVQHATQARQLESFFSQLKLAFGKNVAKKKPRNWLDAFWMLTDALETKGKTEKMVVLLDELSWLATPKSGFLEALGFFWNSWASRKNIVVVICGSAASWMIQKVVYDKGGLHNRITKRIDLEPFNLYETELFLRSRGLNFERKHILLLYMTMGGIPHYLKEVERGKSAIQNINEICFTRSGILYYEFSKLYPALFEHADNHITVVRALAKKWKGMSRAEIITTTGLPDGGGISEVIDELVDCGFVSSYFPFGKKKREMLFRLTDEYSLFYIHFIENQRNQGEDIWQHLSQTPAWISWSGYAFESICIKHLAQLKKKLSIAGIYAEASSYLNRGSADLAGIQIDLVLDRRDQVINLFEMKFYTTAWAMTQAESKGLLEKIALFKAHTKTSKQVFLTVVSAMGLTRNENSFAVVDSEVNLDDLFEPI
jgi:uncharacterized protein